MTNQFELTHSYGLFRRMTGVGGRPEVVIEMQTKSEKWIEVEFMYKPTSLSKSCPWCFPHQPRLDWQMWFAALGQYNHNPWLGDQFEIKKLNRYLYTKNLLCFSSIKTPSISLLWCGFIRTIWIKYVG
jgi:hypothetical protein